MTMLHISFGVTRPFFTTPFHKQANMLANKAQSGRPNISSDTSSAEVQEAGNDPKWPPSSGAAFCKSSIDTPDHNETSQWRRPLAQPSTTFRIACSRPYASEPLNASFTRGHDAATAEKMPCNRAHTASRPPPLPEATSCQVPDILEQLSTNRSNNSGAPPVSPAAVRTGTELLPNVKHPLSAASQSSIKPSDRKTFWNPVKRDEPWTIVASLATHDEWRNSEQQSQRPTLTVRHSSS